MLESTVDVKEESIEDVKDTSFIISCTSILSDSSEDCKPVLGEAAVIALPSVSSIIDPAHHHVPKRYRYSELYPDEVQEKLAQPTEDPLQVPINPLMDQQANCQLPQHQVIPGAKRKQNPALNETIFPMTNQLYYENAPSKNALYQDAIPCVPQVLNNQLATGVSSRNPTMIRKHISRGNLGAIRKPSPSSMVNYPQATRSIFENSATSSISAAQASFTQNQIFHDHSKGRIQQGTVRMQNSNCSLQVVPTATSHVPTRTTTPGQLPAQSGSVKTSRVQPVSTKPGDDTSKCVSGKPANFLERIDLLLKKNEEVVHGYTAPAFLLSNCDNPIKTQKGNEIVKQKSVPKSRQTLIPKSNHHVSIPKPQYVPVPQYVPIPKIEPSLPFVQIEDPIEAISQPEPQKPAPKYKCKHCKIDFDTKKELNNHMEASFKTCSVKFPCLICKTYFCNLIKFNEHMVDAHRTCKICNEKFKSKYEYSLHESNHKAGLIIFYHCPHCLNEYKVKKLLQDHILTNHPGKPIHEYQQERKDLPLGCSILLPHQCVYCDRLFPSNKDLEQHLRSHNIGLGTK